MLIHIVLWKYKSEVSEEARAEHVLKLKQLPDQIPNIESFQVGRDIIHLDRSFDTGLTSSFLDRDALDLYTNHAAHQDAAALGKHLAEKVASVDFFVE